LEKMAQGELNFNSEITNNLDTSTRIYFGVVSAHRDEWEGCTVLSRATDT
jgi:hypothetical protein